MASHGEPFSYFTWAHKVPTDGDPGGRLPWGPVSDIQLADIGGEPPNPPPHRHPTPRTGRLEALPRRRDGPPLAARPPPPRRPRRPPPLPDVRRRPHRLPLRPRGHRQPLPCSYDGSDLRRHTDHDAFYARHAASDGTRVVYQCAGDLWIVDDLSAASVPRKLDVRLSGPLRPGRRTYQVPAAQHVDGISVDETGRASAVVVRGSLYWLTHRDGPARTITDTPGVRVRLPEMLGSGGQVAYVTDADGEDAIEIAYLPAPPETEPPPARLGRTGPRTGTGLETRRANASRSRRMTAGCCSWTRPRTPTARSRS
ncbi:hypothetical protein ACRAWF_46945 [Streptomyces sp. L7]